MYILILGEWWTALAGIEKVFWGISIVFSVLFFIQFILSLLGLDFDTETDVDGGMESGLDADFTILSVRSFIAFFTFFGWAGVGVLNGGGTAIVAIGAGIIAGVSAMLVVGYVMYAISQLTDDGRITDPFDAIDTIGTVYLRIPGNSQGQGKITLNLNGSLREWDAVTLENEQLPTGSSIRVIEVLDDKILVVEPADKYLNSGH